MTLRCMTGILIKVYDSSLHGLTNKNVKTFSPWSVGAGDQRGEDFAIL